jgi:hypothetical protein
MKRESSRASAVVTGYGSGQEPRLLIELGEVSWAQGASPRFRAPCSRREAYVHMTANSGVRTRVLQTCDGLYTCGVAFPTLGL